jgi:hypothetical protein
MTQESKTLYHLAAGRMLTALTGTVTENQAKTLNAWGKALLEGVQSYQIDVDIQEKKITYRLKMKKNKTIKDTSSMVFIERGAWALLGDEWITSFKSGKGMLYEGNKRQK